MPPLQVLVFTPYPYDTSPGQRFRIEQWARLISPEDARFQFIPFTSPELHQILYRPGHYAQKIRQTAARMIRRFWSVARSSDGIDVILLHRELLPFGPALLERLLATKGPPLIYDFDDAIYLRSSSDANRIFGWLKSPGKTGSICRMSSVVIAGNEFLGDYARRFAPNVVVIPTTIDTDLYRPRTSWTVGGRPVIGWSGSITSIICLRDRECALKSLAHCQDFELKVIGYPDYSLPGVRTSSQPWNAVSEVHDLEKFDIGIMPLPDDPWTIGKCGLKALQYMALGIPTVASPVGVNTSIIEDGRNGFLASSPEEWVEKLTLLIHDSDLRRQLGQAGRRTVEERFSGKTQAGRLLDLLRRKPIESRVKEATV